MVLALIWAPSRNRGFCEDDVPLVPVTLSQFVENRCGEQPFETLP
jgi:hypothetical protein